MCGSERKGEGTWSLEAFISPNPSRGPVVAVRVNLGFQGPNKGTSSE